MINEKSRHILLLGDSIDRYLVADWCSHHNKSEPFGVTQEVEWGGSELKYGGHFGVLKSPSYCMNELGDSMAAMHIFGSRPNGPYFTSGHEVLFPLAGLVTD